MSDGGRRAPSLTTRQVLIGKLYALFAGALWGLVFIAPLMLPGMSPIEIASGRYVAYGLFAAVLLLLAGPRSWPAWDVWWMAAKLTFVGSLVYYALTLFGIVNAGAPVVTLIIGVLPVTMAIAGNFVASRAHDLNGAVPWLRLVGPAVAILAGLIAVHVGEHGIGMSSTDAPAPMMGILFGCGALLAWTWYGVSNATYLASRPDVSAATMASLQGVTLLPVALPLLIASIIAGATHPSPGVTFNQFAVTSLILGIGPSWLAAVFWNRASQALPPSLLGQLIVFETLAGLLYAFLWRGQWPHPLVALGALLLIFGVLLGMHIFQTKS